MKILITGANGFIGKNLQTGLAGYPDTGLLLFDLPQAAEDLRKHIRNADFVFHLAGVNRPQNDKEFQTGNTDLTDTLLQMIESENRKIPLVLTSSVQAELNNPYGQSKKAAEDLVFAYAKKNGAPAYVYRLPNVFGKWCKPNYNSVVATFCHNSANKIPLRIDDPEKQLTLLYIDDILSEFQKVLAGKITPSSEMPLSVAPTYKITLGQLAEKITAFAQSRRTFTVKEDMSDELSRKLFATFLSYVPLNEAAIPAAMKTDERGFFAELIRSPHFGQISMSRTKPGVTRGNHWHSTKVEKFIVIEGNAIIRLRKIGSEEITEHHVSGNEIKVVDMPPGCTHSIQNIGSTDVLTIFWTGETFDPQNPDTIFESV